MRRTSDVPLLLLCLGFILLSPAVRAVPTSIFDEGTHCVGYRVEKVMFLVSSSYVVGRNCDVSAQVLPEVGGLYHIEVNIPVRAFQSGDPDRDKDVMEILKAAERPEITFRSYKKTASQWRDLFAKKDFDLEGELLIGKQSHQIKVRTQYLNKSEVAEVDGFTKLNFKDLGLEPPRVAGGVVVKAKPQLELHFHLMSHRILGADSIRLN